ERPVRVLYTQRGLTKLDVVDEAAVTARYHIPGRAYADYAVLRGDPSDGLPGVAGVGEKTAAALVRTFGTVEAMLAAIEAGRGGELEHPEGDHAGVVLGVGRSERGQHGGDHPARIADAGRRGGERGQPLLQ